MPRRLAGRHMRTKSMTRVLIILQMEFFLSIALSLHSLVFVFVLGGGVYGFVPITLSVPTSRTTPLLGTIDSTTPSEFISRRQATADFTKSIVSVAAIELLPERSNAIEPSRYEVTLEVQVDNNSRSGEIVIEVIPEWAPLAAQRFEELLLDGFFDNSKFFRVLPGYVAQFGIAGDPEKNKKWLFDKTKALKDEPRLQPNKKGTLSFASSGKNSRQTQIFLNLANNDGPPNFLDAQGFVPFARVIKGMDDVVPLLYSGYGTMETVSAGLAGSVNQGKAAYYGNEYLEALFPKLSPIVRATKR